MAGKDKVPGRSHGPAAQHGRMPGSQVGKRSAAQAAAQSNTPKAPSAYETFLARDPSGKTILSSAMRDMTLAAWALHCREPAKRSFPVEIGNAAEVDESMEEYPAPSMAPWKTEIGKHEIWLRGDVKIDDKRDPPVFHVVMTMTIKPLGHSRFKRYDVKRKFDFTPEEVEDAPFENPVLQA